MEQLPPIPTPPQHQWREFRIKRIPLILFLGAVFAVGFIWKNHIAAPGIVGEVESLRADIISTLPGLILELNVDRFEKVRKDQIIAKIAPTDPEALKASLAVIQIDLQVLRARMALDRERNSLNHEQVWLDLLNLRVELATAKVNLQFAENEYQRHLKLHQEKIASASELEFYKDIRDTRQIEISEKTAVLAEMEARLNQMKNSTNHVAEETDALAKAVAAQEAQLLLTEGPITLRSPIDGFVSEIVYQAGARVMAGEPILTIKSSQSTRIVGYVRQPLTRVPKTGDTVQVRTRSLPRRTALAKVLHVGAGLQPPISTTPLDMESAVRDYDNPQTRGLPFLVNVPDGLEVFPGELVELIFKSK